MHPGTNTTKQSKAIIKFQNMEDKEKNLKASEMKKSNFSKTILDARRQWHNIFQALKKVYRFLYLVKDHPGVKRKSRYSEMK